MKVTTEKTVRELALENPAATRVFEKLGIDYCCGGNQSLEQACRAANLPVDQVLDSLEMAEQTTRAARKIYDWQMEPLGDLVAHIKNTHHKYTREEIAASVLCSSRSALYMAKTILNWWRSAQPLRAWRKN